MQAFSAITELIIRGDVVEAARAYSELAGLSYEEAWQICSRWYANIRAEGLAREKYRVWKNGDLGYAVRLLTMAEAKKYRASGYHLYKYQKELESHDNA